MAANPYVPNAVGLLPDAEVAYIADMAIYLGFYDVNPLEEMAGDHVPSHYYTCRHFDEASGRCSAYESRPAMCRQYPYGKGCSYVGCTMRGNCGVEARATPAPTDDDVYPETAVEAGHRLKRGSE